MIIIMCVMIIILLMCVMKIIIIIIWSNDNENV